MQRLPSPVAVTAAAAAGASQALSKQKPTAGWTIASVIVAYLDGGSGERQQSQQVD